MSSYSVIQTTCENMEDAKALANFLVSERMAACVNIIPNVHSVYMWEDKVVSEDEVILRVKTRTDMVEKVMIKIRHQHKYDLPAIYSFNVTKCDEPYMHWVDKNLL